MSEPYTGDPTTNLIVASTLPNDGDLRDVASVRVSLQALLDSIASIASGTWTMTGIQDVDGGSIQLKNGSSVLLTASFLTLTTSALLIDAASFLTMHGQGTLTSGASFTVEGGSNFQVATGATAHVRSGGNITVDVGGKLEVLGGDGTSGVDVHDTGIVHVRDGGRLQVEPNGILQIAVGGIQNVYGELNLRSMSPTEAGIINLNTSTQMRVHDGAVVRFDAISLLQFDGAEVGGSKRVTGPTIFDGNDAYRGKRKKTIMAPATNTPVTVSPHQFDRLTLSTTVTSDFSIVLNDVPNDVEHDFLLWVGSATNEGVTTFIVTIKDAHGHTINHIVGDDWNIFTALYAYDPDPGVGLSRWTLLLSNFQV